MKCKFCKEKVIRSEVLADGSKVFYHEKSTCIGAPKKARKNVNGRKSFFEYT
jgi:hypothetical protein